MIRSSFLAVAFGVLVMAALGATPAAAQNARSWVSGTGSDANPCTRTQPCRTFVGAFAKTLSAGEIDALDPGEFGALSIDRAITIDGGPGVAIAVGVNTDAIQINAGSNDVVTLRNLSIDGFGNGQSGIGIYGGRAVVIENCFISRFISGGISFRPFGGMTVTVRNTTLQNNALGIIVRPQGAFYARLTAEHVRLANNNHGMFVEDNSLVFVRDSTVSDNKFNGLYAKSFFGGGAELDVENTSSSNNGNAGIVSENSGAVVRISNSTIDHNLGAGVVPLAGGQTLSYGNNKVAANAGGDGTMTGPAALK